MSNATSNPSAYTSPRLECDIVMKGGITSGVVYPQAVAELARTYRLRQVGGASAGAIAAAAAAAAELGRHLGGGFEELDRMPADLTRQGPDGRSTLATFFQPTKTAAPLFGLLGAIDGRTGGGLVRAVLVHLLAAFWVPVLLGALPGLVIIVVSALGSGPALLAGIIAGLLLALIGLVAGLAYAVVQRFGAIATDDLGMCTGMPGVDSGNAPALTPWLHAKIASLAGRGPGADPLTFGDLDAAGITLQMMTTNLMRHQPMTMPWASREFFFDPRDFRRLFPADVVDWMVSHPAPLPSGKAAAFDAQVLRDQAAPLVPWPAAADLPVVVATRMSLSFPVLIQPVRLMAVDYNQPDNREARDLLPDWRRDNPMGSTAQAASQLPAPRFDPVWFTDGGLCANLPVHFFDTPLPKRPTFAFNLGGFPPGMAKSDDQRQNSHLPTSNQGGALRPWFPLEAKGPAAWVGFFLLMFHTARDWVDGEQLVMPGYRDRIVTVFNDATEGGMNLNMPAEVVQALSLRGKYGAQKLVDTFTGEGWTNHRWIRFRTSTAGLGVWLEKFRSGYADDTSGGVPYAQLAGPGASGPLPSYAPPSGAARAVVNDRTGALVGLAQDWAGDDAMGAGAPTPRPQLRLVPGDGTAAGRAAMQRRP
ncbi:hypothetical protein ACQB6R_05485 [Propionibacteriaceae bacterium G1746]